MLEYFKLQYKISNRKWSDFGIYPLIGYILLLAGFIGFSMLLFHQTEFAPYIYMLIPLYFITNLNEIKRNDFLKICFSKKQYHKIRILENLISIFPFVCFLSYKTLFYPALFLAVLSIFLALLNFNTNYNITIPTPFGKKPFEFTVGFRNTFFLFIIAYIITSIAIVVDNFNLGIFSLMLVFLSILTYYLKPENEYFVWSYSLTPTRFLTDKIKTAFLFSFLLCIPILVALSIAYFEHIGILIFFTFLGYMYLTTIILAKYSAYPDDMDIPQIILIFIGVFVPFMLIVIIPYLAIQSTTKIKKILE